MRNISFSKGEYYHVYNRGVDKRSIFQEPDDVWRFLQSMQILNTIEPSGGIYINSVKKFRGSTSKLVEFITYCLNQNHYHFVLKPLAEDGIQKFMHRLSTGYTMFFNEKYKRCGALFQGRYKASHVTTNEYLLHISVYTNLNDRVHQSLNKPWLKDLPFSSFREYQSLGGGIGLCNIDVIVQQFNSPLEYSQYAEAVLGHIIKRKEQEALLRSMTID